MDVYLVPVFLLPCRSVKIKMLAKDEMLIEKTIIYKVDTHGNCLCCHHYIPGPGFFFPSDWLCMFILSTVQFLFDGILLFCNHLN